MEETIEPDRPHFRERFGSALDRAETIYLKILRAVILLIATLLIGYAAFLAAVSLYKISQSPNSVKEAPAVVAPEELTSADAPIAASAPGRDAEPAVNPAQRAAYDNFVKRYYQLFRTKFEPFRQSEDKKLTRTEFDDNFVDTASRLASAGKGELNFAADAADLETLLQVVTRAADLPATADRLKKYKAARKVRVCRNVAKTRTTYREGWDRYSTACANWFYDPIGCPVRRAVETPYTERVCEMKFPEGTQSHTEIFRAYQTEFYRLLEQRRNSNAADAEAERIGILAGIAEGKLSLMTVLQILAGFLLLMFFFLLIAIERHQRRLAAEREE